MIDALLVIVAIGMTLGVLFIAGSFLLWFIGMIKD